MKTDDLVKMLTNEPAPAPMRQMYGYLAIGILVTFLVLLVMPLFSPIAVRPHYFDAMGTGLVAFKQIAPLLLVLMVAPLVGRLAYPEQSSRGLLRLIAPYVALVAGLFIWAWLREPDATKMMAIRGKSALRCLTMIPVFSAPVFFAIVMWLHRGAPSSPARVGLVAGLLAGGVGAFVYAFSCVDDNPMYWAWAYTSGIAISGVLGAVVGAKFLRW